MSFTIPNNLTTEVLRKNGVQTAGGSGLIDGCLQAGLPVANATVLQNTFVSRSKEKSGAIEIKPVVHGKEVVVKKEKHPLKTFLIYIKIVP